jgi:mono/diheme cytochrome c family protein
MYRPYTIGLVSIMLLSSFAEKAVNGKEVFKKQCANCHGENGTKGSNGARNLQLSHMQHEDIEQLILNGRRPMPSYKTKLSPEQVKLVADYVISLRKS